ncbi:hypothetical protein D3C87_1236420 [compost metagenome]
MSQLITVSCHPTKYPDKVIAAFDGSAVASLGQVIARFNEESLARCKRLVSGEIEAVPEVIVENSQRIIDTCPTPAHMTCPYTIVQIPEGFEIWISDGPDKYRLID